MHDVHNLSIGSRLPEQRWLWLGGQYKKPRGWLNSNIRRAYIVQQADRVDQGRLNEFSMLSAQVHNIAYGQLK